MDNEHKEHNVEYIQLLTTL